MSLPIISLAGPCPAFARISRTPDVFELLAVDTPEIQVAIWQPRLSRQAKAYLKRLPERTLPPKRDYGGKGKVWRGKRPDLTKVTNFFAPLLVRGAGRAEVLATVTTAFRYLARLSPAGFGHAQLRLSKPHLVKRTSPAKIPHYDHHNAWTLFGGSGTGTVVYDTRGLDFTQLRKAGLVSRRHGAAAKFYGSRPIPKAQVLKGRGYHLPEFSFSIWRAGKIANPLLHDFPQAGACGGRASVVGSGYVVR